MMREELVTFSASTRIPMFLLFIHTYIYLDEPSPLTELHRLYLHMILSCRQPGTRQRRRLNINVIGSLHLHQPHVNKFLESLAPCLCEPWEKHRKQRTP